jgi:exosortase A
MTSTTDTHLIEKDSLWRIHFVQFALLLIALCAAQWSTLTNMIEIWYYTTTYNHGFIVAPASAYLIWRRRDELAQVVPENAFSALFPLVCFCIFGLIGELSGVNLARHVGFVGALMCLVPLCFGWAVVRRFFFPILFLGFMIPVGDFLIAPLQVLTADVSVWMIQMTGVPVYREGLMIELSSGLWEVAEACAGVRFLIANFFICAIFAYLSYDKLWKWIVFAILAIVIPIAANCVRAYGIMMLAHVTDNALAVGVDHLVYGWVFFSAIMLLMLWIGSKFADRPLTDPVVEMPVRSSKPSRGGLGVAISGALLIAGGPAFAALSKPVPTAIPTALIEPLMPNGWNIVSWNGDAPDRWIPRFDSADRAELERISNGTDTLDMMVAYYTHQREGAEALHFANRFDDDTIWIRSALGQVTVDTGKTGLPQTARRDSLTWFDQSEKGTAFSTRLVTSWVWVGDTLTADPVTAKLAGMKSRLSGGEAGAAVIAFSVQYDDPAGEARARETIEALLQEMKAVAPTLEAMGDE